MGMTITEKIMARCSGRDSVQPGELIWVDINTVMTMDYLGKQCFSKFRSLGKTEVFDKDRVICVSDHLVPPPNQKFATMLNEWREVVKEHDITHFCSTQMESVNVAQTGNIRKVVTLTKGELVHVVKRCDIGEVQQ